MGAVTTPTIIKVEMNTATCVMPAPHIQDSFGKRKSNKSRYQRNRAYSGRHNHADHTGICY